MDTSPTVSRRGVLLAAGAGAGAVALAGCGGSDSRTSSAPASTAAPSSAPAPSSGAPASSAPASGKAVAQLADVPVGGSVSAEVDGKPVVVAQPKAGTVVCWSAICTHQGCTVPGGGAQLHCPCHGSVFDAATGAVVNGPARRPLTAVAVAVSGGAVVRA